MKKAFQRRCMACNTKKNKYDLIRIVKNKKGEILVDKTGKLNGRGAYICNNIECIEKVIKTNRISRGVKSDTEQKNYENIRGVIIGNEQNKQTNS